MLSELFGKRGRRRFLFFCGSAVLIIGLVIAASSFFFADPRLVQSASGYRPHPFVVAGALFGFAGLVILGTAFVLRWRIASLSEYRSIAALEAVGDLIHIIDRQYRLSYTNPAYEQWADSLGLASSRVGNTLFALFPILSDKIRDEYELVFATGELLATTEKFKIGEKELTVEVRKIPVFQSDKVECVLTVIHNVTEKARAEEQLNLRNTELEERAIEHTTALEKSNLQLQQTIHELEETQQHLQRLAAGMSALYKSSLLINSQAELSLILDEIICQAVTVPGEQMGVIYLVQPDGQALNLAASYLFPEINIPEVQPVKAGLVGETAWAKEIIKIPNFHLAESQADINGFDGCRAIGIPLKTGERLVGVLALMGGKPGQFTEDETATLGLFADQAAIAIENDRLRQVEKALHDFMLELAGTTTLDEALNLCLEEAINISGLDSGGIYLYDHASESLKLACRLGIKPDFAGVLKVILPGEPRWNLVMSGDPVYDNSKNVSLPAGYLQEEGLHALALLPIFHQRQVIGCFSLASHTLNEVPETARVVLETIAAQVGTIIARLQAEKIMQQSQVDLQTLFDSSDDFLVVIDRIGGKILQVNQVVNRRLGYQDGELLGQSSNCLFPARLNETIGKNFEAILAGETNTSYLPLITKEGVEIPVETRISVCRWKEQPALFGISRDVTQRKQMEDALRESEKKAQALLNATNDAVYLLDIHGTVLGLNENGARRFNRSSVEMLGKCFYNFFPLPLNKERKELITRVFQTGIPQNVQGERDGVWMENTIYPIFDAQGNVAKIAVFSRDISRQRNAEIKRAQLFDEVKAARAEIQERAERLEDANARLKELDRIKSQFLANMSHELRTPLNSVIGFSEVLQDGILGEISQQQRSALEEIWHSSKHLLDLINNLLDFSRIENGRMMLHKTTFKLCDLVDDVKMIVHPLAAKKSQELLVRLETGMPPVTADRLRLKQILLNLLGNASKFTQEGGHITLACSLNDNDQVLFSVSDDGIGISAEDQKIIFEEFRQVDGTVTRSEAGSGLGLTISKRLVELAGGQIWVESQLGKGAVFSVLLPVAAESINQS
jgi:PAS domain S-box-containing protein